MSDYTIGQYEPLWGSWRVGELIGKGSYGSVYKIYKTVRDTTYISAMKHITFPTNEQLKTLKMSMNGLSGGAINEAMEDMLHAFQKEIDILYAMKGNTHIVSHEDHEIMKRSDGTGWDVCIRMEYLQTMQAYLQNRELRVADVVKLGIDMCTALETVHAKGILHRDIKEENMFVSSDGNFKLGDFGVARTLLENEQASTRVGTPLYMAPEVVKGMPYHKVADIYTLGLVLYKLLNDNQIPFLPQPPAKIGLSDIEKAQFRRLRGEPLAAPPLADAVLGQLILRACHFAPEQRFASAAEFKQALEQYARTAAPEARAQVVLAPAAKAALSQDDETVLLRDVAQLGETVLLPREPKAQQAEQSQQTQQNSYRLQATQATPATIIYLLDISGSMSLPLGDKRRIDVVTEALSSAIKQMVFRSTKGSRVLPRYRLAVLAYSDQVYDLLGGVQSIDRLAQFKIPQLSPMKFTDTARGLAYVEKLLQAELPSMQHCPAPLVCHMTDGAATGEDPEPVAERIRQLSVADGHVLLENIFISNAIMAEEIKEARKWRGMMPDTALRSEFAEKLRRMSSVLPESYRETMLESSYSIDKHALMMLPGTSPELVSLGFQMSAATPIR